LWKGGVVAVVETRAEQGDVEGIGDECAIVALAVGDADVEGAGGGSAVAVLAVVVAVAAGD
jgi:hypothetical protein